MPNQPEHDAASPPPPFASLDKKLAEARRELLETSTRSRLLHTPLGSSRAKIVEIQDELSEQLLRILVREGKTMTFVPSRDDLEDSEMSELLSQPDESSSDDGRPASRHTDRKLQTTLPSSKLQSRLLSIAYDAQLIQSEQGVNVLYLALGFLKWCETQDQETPRYAPLILIPVTLTRQSAGERFTLAYSGDELGTNLSLKERLKEERLVLPDLPDVEDLSPNDYTAKVEAAIVGIPHWGVQRDSVVLGFFSFAKLMMYRDLDPDLWPVRDGLRDHPIIGGLLGEGFRSDSNQQIPDDIPVDALIDISTAGHVVDADSSQMLAIEDVRGGGNLVIQGPPGTGKSQTITNLIASAVLSGKRVLFVAEKMAALNVVYENLTRVGLGQMCLQLHSHKAKKKDVLADLAETYQLANYPAGQAATLAAELRNVRDVLNEHVRHIHTPLEPSAKTPFEVFSKLARLEGRGVSPPDFQLSAARNWTSSEMQSRTQVVLKLAQHAGVMGVPNRHPWRGVGLDVILPQDAQRFANRANDLYHSFAELRQAAMALEGTFGMSCSTLGEGAKLVRLGILLAEAPPIDPQSIGSEVWLGHRNEIAELVTHGLTYSNARKRLEKVLVPGAWDADVSEIRRAFTTYGESWFRWLHKDYRTALRQYKSIQLETKVPPLPQRFEILHVLTSGQNVRMAVQARDAMGASAFGVKWSRENSNWLTLDAIEKWEQRGRKIDLPDGWRTLIGRIRDWQAFVVDIAKLGQILTQIDVGVRDLFRDLVLNIQESLGVDDVGLASLSSLSDRIGAFAAAPQRIHQWAMWRIWSREARAREVGDLVDRLADGRITAVQAGDICEYACYEALSRQAFATYRDLAVFDGRSHGGVVAEFQRLDRECIARSRQQVATQHIRMMPAGSQNVGEIGTLAREWNKRNRHLPLRTLIKSAGRAMQQIKPVWMMSPMSLAQFAEPGAIVFDLVLMDEASQIRPVEALGAVARGRQAVVVGDDKQLPPTSFFDRVAFEDSSPPDAEEFQVADVESILGLCSAQGFPDRMLRWHYRSQHESLIAVSNLEFYKRLFIVPSAHSEDLGLRFRKVRGVYDRGRTATNRIEAEEVAKAVLDHARRYRRCARYPEGMSLCVGTFSVAQRDAILDEVELLRRQHPELEAFFDPNETEEFFVKNLESIQGDERDVVLISVGYGPDADGYFAMGFGPIASQGGERRLNVLISRARRRCEVFSSITSADIDLARATSVGARVLKTFLQYAETGRLDRGDVDGARPVDSDFEEDVGAALSAAGYDVQHQVGVAGFFVDLAIKDPNRPGSYLLGIECDGATYHSSRSARDRDRLREELLATRGWRIHRVWSTDWFRRRQEELQRAIGAIEAARLLGAYVPEVPPVNVPPAEVPRITETQGAGPTRLVHRVVSSVGYVQANFREALAVEPHELRLEKRVPILVRIVEIEGPVHEDEIARRFAAVCGKDRTGTRIQRAVKDGLARATRDGRLHREGPFYTVLPITACDPRDRHSVDSLTIRKADMLPPVEIRTGLLRIVADHIGVEPAAAIVEAARMLGFDHTGQDLKRVIEEQLRAMLGDGLLVLNNGNKLYKP
jgi:very-short-patch-repair endonuclease